MDLDMVDHPGRFFSSLARDLKSLALSNIQFFKHGKQSHHAKFHMSFSLLYEYLDIGIEPSYRELSKHLSGFDYSPEVKGNGYRSLLEIVQKCCLHLLQLSRYIASVKDSILFRKKLYSKELESYVSALGQLRAILYYSLKLINYCQDGELFADEENLDNEVADHLMMEVESLNLECFYGRCLGFQYCESMLRPVQVINIAMASYSEGYLESSGMMQVATSVFNSGKYFLDPELRASQLGKVTRTADIKFCKAFWSILESSLIQQLPSMVCPSVEVDEYFPLGPDAFELPLVDGSDTVVITPPCAHVGPGHVMVRLISAHLREGQQFLQKPTKNKVPPVTKPRTPGLVIHMHGGGFVAQSSKSHEIYLRDWARILNVPILSVDYSLAPELPFPRALEDCFYAYSWAVKNCQQLGSLGERIILAGDSAGGNLAISTAMRAASFEIRKPDGVVGVYPVTMARYLPSPARLLSLMDPVLPVGLVSRCLAAYAGINEEHPLASPSSEQFHSEASLSSIQMQTVESSDNEWIIIGQDEEECLKVNRQLEQSPVVRFESTSKSVIDAMDNSYHDDLSDSPTDREGKFYRSDTVESDEVEIFSQLQVAGSCVFPSDDDKKDSSTRQKAHGSREAVRSTDVKEIGKISAESVLRLSGGIQETAKSVIEGAQSMFSSLSSYIPSRTAAGPSTSGVPSTTSTPIQPTDFAASPKVDKEATNPTLKSDLSPTVVAVLENDLVEVPLSDTEKEKTADSPVTALGHAIDDSEDVGSNMESSQSSSVNFNTAMTSSNCGSEIPPLPKDHDDHNFDSISFTSDLSPLQDRMKPKLGLSPNVESMTKPNTPLELLSTPLGLSQPLGPLIDISEDSPSNGISPSVPSHSLSTSSDILYPQDALQPATPDAVQSPADHQMTCSIDDNFGQNHESLNAIPSLPPENKQLLQDAIKPTENLTHDSNCVSETALLKDNLTTQGGPGPGPATPPSDLGLTTTIRSNLPKTNKPNPGTSLSPSPHQIFVEDSSVLDNSDTDMDAAIFETSCLEFLGPSSSPVDPRTSRSAIPDMEAQLSSDIFRSESSPALSSMLSPSPSQSQQLFPNGLKTGMSPSDFKRQTFTPNSPINTMRKAPVVRNPYMSPLMADAELLQGLPQVCLVAAHLDPLLDDSIMFAKKLRKLSIPIDLHLVDDLPHGFLNFSLISPEAKRASQLCANKILDMLNQEI